MNRATALVNKLLLALSDAGLTAWRNNTGVGWAGKSFQLRPGEVYRAKGGERVVMNARPLRAGLCPGSGDIIGIETITITPDMVGQRIGRFVSVEAKSGSGRPSRDQTTFKDHVNETGGRAIIARDPADVARLFRDGS